MKYLETAFKQLEFSIKLMVSAESGALKVEEIDTPIRIDEGPGVLVLPDRVLSSQDDFVNACQNNVTIAFGAAAITLNRCREEAGARLPDPITTEVEEWIGLVYQIRNAFAHDISEPRWNITKARFARNYVVERIRADLTSLNGVPFEYVQIGGLEALFALKDYGSRRIFTSE
jgi:hypothetical protein